MEEEGIIMEGVEGTMADSVDMEVDMEAAEEVLEAAAVR
jgi:hypothetical protein